MFVVDMDGKIALRGKFSGYWLAVSYFYLPWGRNKLHKWDSLWINSNLGMGMRASSMMRITRWRIWANYSLLHHDYLFSLHHRRPGRHENGNLIAKEPKEARRNDEKKNCALKCKGPKRSPLYCFRIHKLLRGIDSNDFHLRQTINLIAYTNTCPRHVPFSLLMIISDVEAKKKDIFRVFHSCTIVDGNKFSFFKKEKKRKKLKRMPRNEKHEEFLISTSRPTKPRWEEKFICRSVWLCARMWWMILPALAYAAFARVRENDAEKREWKKNITKDRKKS